MAENEIAKHTKTIYKTLKNKEEGWLQKLKEIIVEILIIVFAVSISIWFHNWSDRLHERTEEKEFLTGLQKDLNGDMVNLNESLQFYKYSLAATDYFLRVGKGAPFNKDSVNKYDNVFFSSTDLEPHTSRYEGLKGSNSFGIIEDKELLNDIIDLHESIFTRINNLDKYYHDDISNKMVPFISSRVILSANGASTNGRELAQTSEMRILMMTMNGYVRGNLIEAHLAGIAKCKQIIKKIDEELK
jgi:hypothetical protein